MGSGARTVRFRTRQEAIREYIGHLGLDGKRPERAPKREQDQTGQKRKTGARPVGERCDGAP